MYYPDYNTGKTILTEGNWFLFRVHKKIQLQDGCNYYVLEDVNGMKHFMPAWYYAEYGINDKDEIICKVDKINCTGRIFLEPENPFYSEGNKYFFEIKNGIISGEKSVIIVDKNSGKEIQLPLTGDPKVDFENDSRIECVVKRIKKGVIYVEIA